MKPRNGYNRVDVKYDETKKLYYLDETLEFVKNSIEEISEGLENKRLYISAVDYARGRVGCIAHLNNPDNILEGFQTAQGSGIEAFHDFTYANNELTFVNVNTGEQVAVSGRVLFNNFPTNGNVEPAKKGCKGSLLATSLIICIPSMMGATLLISKKKKGDKENEK